MKAKESRMKIMDAMDGSLATNLLTSLNYLNYRSYFDRKELASFIFNKRQKKYKKEASMDEQVKVFFKHKVLYHNIYRILVSRSLPNERV